ncbi:MAG: hypothetical protein KF729_38980 [Sandaracinaceae bacterium]|nr:hypothetical protein [Sandaracinaceae bacterium]
MSGTVRVADTLADAGPRDLVHVDGKGRVRSRARAQALTVGYWGLVSTLVGIEAYLGYALLGWPGLSIAAALGGWVGWVFTRVGHLKGGVRSLVSSDLEGAEAHFERVAHARLVPRHLKARALAGLAGVARVRGDDALALERIRRAIALSRRPKAALAQTARHHEAQLLARLDRHEEARAVLEEIGEPAPGEYVRLSHHTTELYLAFRAGRHALSDDALHERASFALPITAAAPLLALLGWAFSERGDDEMAELLVGEARDRHPGELLSGPMPDLDRWMREGARVALEDEADEAEAHVERARAPRAERHGA